MLKLKDKINYLPLASREDHQHELGQFFTPKPIAEFMAAHFASHPQHIELLDAGAGQGALSTAFIKRVCSNTGKPKSISLTAFELDSNVFDYLATALFECERLCERSGIEFKFKILNEDFISSVVPIIKGDFFATSLPFFNAAIVNPPYHKISANSATQALLQSVNIEVPNLYAGFLALIIKLLEKGGELVAITPRSFCNGPYFKLFRQNLLNTMSLERLHVFDSRSSAFCEDKVLQENIIIHGVKSDKQSETIVISNSVGKIGDPIIKHKIDFTNMVSPDDLDQFIHLVLDSQNISTKVAMDRLACRIEDLGVTVSTGRVVDFRVKSFLRDQTGGNTVPLIYPCHFNGGFIHWPRENSRKANAIVKNDKTRNLFVPAGVYVLVKRFTSKEERRRIVACIYDSNQIHANEVGFENHLNYLHINGQGMPLSLAKGLAAFLNSTVLDNYFRQFSGHTQVNATDLRRLRYPSRESLEILGYKVTEGMGQLELDRVVEKEIYGEKENFIPIIS